MTYLTNPGEVMVHDAQLVATVPEFSRFNKPFSDPRWDLFAGTLNTAAGNCPDRHPAGGQCAVPLGDLVPGESISGIRFSVLVDEEIEEGSEALLAVC